MLGLMKQRRACRWVFQPYTSIPAAHPFHVQVKIAIYASLIANIALCVLQSGYMWCHDDADLDRPILVYAAISSLSLSLLATGIDSVFDIGSNVLLFWLHKKAEKLDVNKWPVGGARLETIGNIVYGVFRYFHQTIKVKLSFKVLCEYTKI